MKNLKEMMKKMNLVDELKELGKKEWESLNKKKLYDNLKMLTVVEYGFFSFFTKHLLIKSYHYLLGTNEKII